MAFRDSLSVKDDIEAEINREARAVSINLLTGLVRVTPVDTGRARGNWFVGVRAPNRGNDPTRNARTAISQGSSVIGTVKSISYPTIVLSNNLPYIERLNEGYSDQAPAKFVEKEIDRVANARRLNGG